jgi:hypothetical protein
LRARFASAATFGLSYTLYPDLGVCKSATNICNGSLRIAISIEMFVLGPRLILSIREYHARAVVNSDAGTGMTTIAFEERVFMSTGDV